MGIKLTIIFEETPDAGEYSGGWPDKSLKTFISEYPSDTTWTSFVLDMAEACEGVGYIDVKKNVSFLGTMCNDRDEEYHSEDPHGTPFNHT